MKKREESAGEVWNPGPYRTARKRDWMAPRIESRRKVLSRSYTKADVEKSGRRYSPLYLKVEKKKKISFPESRQQRGLEKRNETKGINCGSSAQN